MKTTLFKFIQARQEFKDIVSGASTPIKTRFKIATFLKKTEEHAKTYEEEVKRLMEELGTKGEKDGQTFFNFTEQNAVIFNNSVTELQATEIEVHEFPLSMQEMEELPESSRVIPEHLLDYYL